MEVTSSSKPAIYVFRLFNARPMELLAMCQANLQWLREQWAMDPDFDPDDYWAAWNGKDVIVSLVSARDMANEAAWRSHADAIRERRQMLNFWTPAARAAAKGQGPEPPVRRRIPVWDGKTMFMLPEMPKASEPDVTLEDVAAAASGAAEVMARHGRRIFGVDRGRDGDVSVAVEAHVEDDGSLHVVKEVRL